MYTFVKTNNDVCAYLKSSHEKNKDKPPANHR